jgi:hypothetical protein
VWRGFWIVEFVVFPSPKFHSHEIGELVEASENTTASGMLPDVGVPVKLTTDNAGLTFT